MRPSFDLIIFILSTTIINCFGDYGEVVSCSLTSTKGFNEYLEVYMYHYYGTSEDCNIFGFDCDTIYHGRHNSNLICLDSRLIGLTETNCEGIMNENSWLTGCNDWSNSCIDMDPNCCIYIFYPQTLVRSQTIIIPGFTFLSLIENTDIYSAAYAIKSGQAVYKGTTCSEFDLPITSGITGTYFKYIYIYIEFKYTPSSSRVFSLGNVTFEFRTDVEVPGTAIYNFEFAFESQLSNYGSCTFASIYLDNCIE